MSGWKASCCCSAMGFAGVCKNCDASAGADLDPLQVLSALSSEMPLSSGVDILSHLLCERLHRHRQGSVIRSLHKACSLSASVDRAEVLLLFSVVAQIYTRWNSPPPLCSCTNTMFGFCLIDTIPSWFGAMPGSTVKQQAPCLDYMTHDVHIAFVCKY